MFQSALFFVAFTVLCCQGAYSKCAILTLLAILCLGSSLLCSVIQNTPNWLRLIAGFSMMASFGLLAYNAGKLYAMYLGRIAEYRFTAIAAVLLMCVAAPTIVPLPRKRAKRAGGSRSSPMRDAVRSE